MDSYIKMGDLHDVHDKNLSELVTADGLTTEEDARILAAMGYKQELKRNFTKMEIFGISFSIVGLLPSIASTLSYSIPSGPVGMVWGWFLASGLLFVVGISMSELGSSLPTSGGLYFWTHHFSAPKWKNPLCFLVGYSNTLGLVAAICSIDYGFALMFLSVISIARDGEWSASDNIVYVVYLCTVLSHGFVASSFSNYMGKMQSFFVFMNFVLIFATIIALPIGASNRRNDGEYIFGRIENGTTWPIGWTFMLAWLSPIWTIGSFDSCVHLAEEASNAVKAVPFGILMSIGSAWVFGTVVLIVIAACMTQDYEAILDSAFGQPMAQIYYDALGKQGALGFMSLVMIVQYMMGISIVVATSRQMWAFSRDGALPFSKFFRVVSRRAGYIPLRTVWGSVFSAAVLGLLCLIDEAAASALFALSVAGNDLAFAIPIFARVFWGNDKFRPGSFYMGRWSVPLAWVSIIYLLFSIVLSMFPVGGPDPAPEDMNYTIVVVTALWGGALAYYYIDARKWFVGPKITLDDGVEMEKKDKEPTVSDAKELDRADSE